MKKLTLATMVSSLLLMSACTTVITTDNPVKKRDDLKHICIKEAKRPRLAGFTESIAKSLEKRGFTSEINIERVAPHCKYMLNYALNTRHNLVLRATVQVQELDNGSFDEIGEIVYKQRGEEKNNVKVTGLQGQTDRIVNELFKNY